MTEQTGKPSLEGRDRPAEIEVTEAMRRAGAYALEDVKGAASDYEAAEAAYIAMERQRLAERQK